MNGRIKPKTPQLVILMGAQASGKSSFYLHQFFATHIRINLDMLKTRHREKLIFEACLAAKQSVVIDNTNPTRQDRARYIGPAKFRKPKKIDEYKDKVPLAWRFYQREFEDRTRASTQGRRRLIRGRKSC